MHVARHKTVCTAQNAFKPSIVLWQQFVAAGAPSRLQRFSSTVATPDSEQPHPPSNPASEQPAQPTATGQVSEQLPIDPTLKPKHRFPRPESVAAANARQVADIKPHDLAATLEAHRASNRASLIHPVASDQNETAFSRRNTSSLIRFSNDKKDHVGRKPLASSDDIELSRYDKPNSEEIHPTLRMEGSKSKLKKGHSSRRQTSISSFKDGKELLEYDGEYVIPLSDIIVPEDQLPWGVKGVPQSMNGVDRLSEEISRFHSYMVPTPNERNARRAVIKELIDLAAEHHPKHRVSVFGSEWNGLAVAISDIDFQLSLPTIIGSRLEKAPRYVVRGALTKGLMSMHGTVHRCGYYMLVSFRHARYPLISLQHIKSRLDLQVVGANDTSVSRSYVKKYLEEYPGLKEVFTVIKVLFEVRGLNDVFRGGLGSYSIFLMTVASMKLSPPVETPSLAQHLLSFLSFWGNFDTYANGVSLEPAETFPKASRAILSEKHKKKLDATGRASLTLSQIDPAQPYLLCLQDPADATNDVGKKGFAIKHIQATFRHLEKELKGDIEANKRASLLAQLIGSSYAVNLERRAIMEEYGASVGHVPEEATEEAEPKPPKEMTVEEFKEEFAPVKEAGYVVEQTSAEAERVEEVIEDPGAATQIEEDAQVTIETVDEESLRATEATEPAHESSHGKVG